MSDNEKRNRVTVPMAMIVHVPIYTDSDLGATEQDEDGNYIAGDDLSEDELKELVRSSEIATEVYSKLVIRGFAISQETGFKVATTGCLGVIEARKV